MVTERPLLVAIPPVWPTLRWVTEALPVTVTALGSDSAVSLSTVSVPPAKVIGPVPAPCAPVNRSAPGPVRVVPPV